MTVRIVGIVIEDDKVCSFCHQNSATVLVSTAKNKYQEAYLDLKYSCDYCVGPGPIGEEVELLHL